MSPKMMHKIFSIFVLIGMIFSLIAPLPVAAAPLAETPMQTSTIEVEESLTEQFIQSGTAGYMIYFREKADLSAAQKMDWEARGWYVMETLKATAERSQQKVRAYLDAKGVGYQSFWIDNIIVVDSSTYEVFNGLMAFSEIESLRARRTMGVIEPEIVPVPESTFAIEPNISHVKAPDVWALGYEGTGITIANIDTGVRYTHQALVNQYRGNLGGGVFDHNYNWWDPYGDHPASPADDNGHGTHTMGTMVGDDGGANQIGMAPDADWIACRGCNTSSCTDTALLGCAQFMAAPTNLAGANPDPSKRPMAVNNSWGDCGQSYDNWYQGVVDAWHAAGIHPVFSNGNSSNCGYPSPPGLNTVGNPARYGNVTGVGSSGQSNGQYATHSNWGPTDNPDTVNPNPPDAFGAALKPQVIAPGVNIRSSVPTSDTSYQGGWSGTSMSAPHVTGLIALMTQAAPCLAGDYATVEHILEETAIPVPYASGGTPPPPSGNQINYATGHGEIDALAAVNMALTMCGPNFSIDVTPPELAICTPNNAVYNVSLDSMQGFNDPVSLDVIGEPGGTTVTFSQNPVVPPFNGTLTIGNTGAAPFGSYTMDVVGVAPTATHTATVMLDVYTATPVAPVLTAPADGATSVPLQPTFEWTASAQAGQYTLEVATDMAFTNIVYTANLEGTSHTMTGMNLDAETTYYWRVKAANACGNSAYSATYSFTTVLLFCSYPNAPISDYSTTSDYLTSSRTDVIADLNVYVQIDHTWTGDLDINLTHQTNNVSSVLLPTSFSCSYDDIDATFDDEAAVPVTCNSTPPSVSGDVQPNTPLNVFDFDQIAGSWRLDVHDGAGGDTGTLLAWCLEPQFATAVAYIEGTVTDQNNGLGIPGATVTLDDGTTTFTALTDANGYYNRPALAGTYTVTAEKIYYSPAEVTGVMLTDGMTTTQNFTLAAGELASSATGFEATLELGDDTSTPWTLSNIGTAPLAFEINIDDNGYSPMGVHAGESILVVNDGGFNTNPVNAFTTALTNLGYTYATVNSSAFAGMPVGDLLAYDAILYAGTVSSGGEQTKAMEYLDAGGRMLVADNDMGYFNWNTVFYQQYLQAAYVSDEGSDGVLTGLDIMAGLNPDIVSDPYPDDFTSGPEGVGIFQAPSGNLAGSRIDRNDYKAIYLAWDYHHAGGSAVGDPIETDILEAALNWMLSSGDFWLYTNVVTGTLGVGANQNVLVTMDASKVALAGKYYANLVVQNDTPYGDVIVPVTMTVVCSTCGTVAGSITDALTGLPLTATVQITNGLGFDYTFEDVTEYSLSVPPETYYISASAFDYYSQMTMTVVTTGVTNTVDFALVPIFAALEYSPAFIEEYMEIGDIVTNTVTITNPGTDELEFTVHIGNYDGPGTLSVKKVSPQPSLANAVPTAPKAEPVITSPEECAAYVNYAGREPKGFAQFCKVDVAASAGLTPAGVRAPTDTGYAQDIGFVSDNFVSFVLNDFTGQTVIGTSTNAYYGMDFDPSATTLYALNDTTDQLGTIDLTTGAFTALVAAPAPGGDIWTGLSIDPTDGTFYASTATDLYTLDPMTGVSTLIGNFGATTLMIDIAVGPDGAMYGHAIDTDAIYSIDKSTGAATLIGSTGYNANYAQGMDFDNSDGTLYIFLYQGGGANVYGTVDLTTGAVTPLAVSAPQGEFEGAIAVPAAGGGWASSSINGGTLLPGESATFEVTFDATSLYQVGDYSAQLVFNGNFENDVDTMPLTMHITCPTCAFLDGEITDSETNAPVEADIHIVGPNGFDVTITADAYDLAVQPGTYDFTVTADGYLTATATVSAVAGQTTTTNFALIPAVARLSYSPAAIEETMEFGQVVTNTVTVTNFGTIDLDFTVKIGNYDGPGTLKVVPLEVKPLNPAPNTDVSLVLDDGSREDALGLTNGGQFIWLNRFTPAPEEFPLTLTEVQIMFGAGVGVNVGETVDIYVYADTDGDADPGTGATLLGSYLGAEVQAVDDTTWSVYTLDTPIVAEGPGDILIAVVNRTAGTNAGEFPAAMDTDSSAGRSWVGIYSSGDPANPPVLPPDSLWGTVDSFGFPGNWMVRGYGVVGGLASWASANPTGGTVPPGSSMTFDVIFNSGEVDLPGTYTADLTFLGNFENAVAPLDLTMHITCPTCGTLDGSITTYETGDPLTATVHVQGDGYDVTVEGTSYNLLAPAGTYTFTVSADGYLSQTAMVQAVQGVTVTTDFVLRLNQPIVSVAPESFEVTLGEGASASYPLSLFNDGAVATGFEIKEQPQVTTLVMPAGPVRPDARTTGAVNGKAAAVFSKSPQDVLLDEGFEAGVMPPTDWTLESLNASYTWKIMTVGTPYEGSYSADVEYDPALEPQDEWLLSPEMTLSEGVLSFWSYGSLYWCRDTNDNCDLNVWLVVGEPGGTDDIFVGTADDDWTNSWEWSQSVYDLTPLLPFGSVQTGPVRIGFQYVGIDGAQVGLDAIMLDGVEGSTDVPWLSVTPVTGTIPADDMAEVMVTFDTMTYTVGTYTATLKVKTDDPLNPTIEIPVTLNIAPVTYDMAMAADADALMGMPGHTVTYTLHVTNTGNIPDTYTVTHGTATWTTQLDHSVIGPLMPGESATFHVMVDVPPDAMGNEQGTVDIIVTSHAVPAMHQTMTLTTTAMPLYDVILSGDLAADGAPGEVVEYTFHITNTGNTTDTFDLSLDDSTWITELDETEITLASGASGTFHVMVTIPTGAVVGDNDTFTVIATSQHDAAATDSASATTTATVYKLFMPLIRR